MTRIVIFAKQPVPGRVKTRLIPALGPEGAARLASELLEWALEEALATGLPVELCGDPDAALWSDAGVHRTGQGQGDLGERLARAARRIGGPLLLIGADCPELGRDRLRAAARALATHDAVIHPADDGGYVLLGLRRFDPAPFEDVAWSTSSVAAETIERIRSLGWSVNLRETLRDVDEPADLAALSCQPRLASILSQHGFQLSLE